MANPTTNFGWVMPTATDLVTDLPADFDVFGQGVDTSLVDLLGGTTGQVLAKASGTDLDFVWSADAAGMTNPMTTTADIIYSSSGSTPARLGIGSTSDVLTVSGGVPTWAAPAGGGGGKVLQVVSTTYSTATTIASTTFTDTGLTLSITPTLATSKILVMFSQQFTAYSGTDRAFGRFQLVRTSTVIWNNTATGRSFGNYDVAGTALEYNGYQSGLYLDSPATTSATTYKTQGRAETTSSGGLISANTVSNMATITLMEIGV